MADRTSAYLFAEIFDMLASDEPMDKQTLAARFWNMTKGYDFCSCQMDCDASLLKLGLAKHVVDPEYGDTVTAYKGEPGFEE